MTLSPGRWAALFFCAVVVLSLFAYWLSLPPAALPVTAPETEFSAERAIKHIEAVSQVTHPAGSEANDVVCDYIIARLKEWDIETEVIHEPHTRGGNSVTWQRAVLARIRGTAPTKAFAADAHFDSVPYGPGAADDMSGIAAMLEALRALKASPPMKNDVIFCFADQEETGGDGARAFTQHPWFKDVGIMLGLETRGTKGPGLMFETSDHNGWIIRQLAKAGVSPRATSIMFDFYDRMPFGSDFGQYKRLVPGYNVAYIDNFCYYHTRLDNPENVNRNSLQHHGVYTLGLARHFGEIPLDGNLYAPNASYFNVLGDWMLVYPGGWGWPLAVLALLLFQAVLIGGVAMGALRPWRVLGAFLAVLGAAVLSALLWAPGAAMVFMRFREAALYQNNAYCLSFALMALVVIFFTVSSLHGRIRPAEWIAGGMVPWVVLLLLFQLFMPGGAYIALFTLLFGTLSLAVLCRAGAGGREPSPGMTFAAGMAVLPIFVVFIPTLFVLGYALTAMGAVMLCALLVLMTSLTAPQMGLMTPGYRRGLPAVLAAVSLMVFAGAYMRNMPGPDTPQLNCLSYGMDFDKGEASWLSADKKTDEFTGQFFPAGTARVRLEEFLPGDRLEYLKAPAPASPFPKPVLEVLSDQIENGRRVVALHFDSPRDALRVNLRLVSPAVIHAASMNGMEFSGGDNWGAYFEMMPREGVRLRLETDPGAPLVFHIREVSYGVPEFPQYKPRPDWMATEPNRTVDHRRSLRSEHTFSVCTIDLGAGPAAEAAVEPAA